MGVNATGEHHGRARKVSLGSGEDNLSWECPVCLIFLEFSLFEANGFFGAATASPKNLYFRAPPYIFY